MRFKIVMVAFLSIFAGNVFAQGPYPPAAGQEGSTAIHFSSSDFVTWGDGIQLTRGFTDISNPTTLASFGYPAIALGIAQESSMDVVSLGDAGEAVITFDRPIVNGDGFDFAVFENGFDDRLLELAFVEVSSDGVNFVRFPAVSLTPEAPQVDTYGSLDPTNLNNLAGKYRQGYGTPFDLDDVAGEANLDVNNVRFVKIIDVVGCVNDEYARYDSQGHKVNDPWSTPFASGGFDLDAVGVINAGKPFSLSNFNDLTLGDNSYWNGSDGSGSFQSGIVEYINSYDQSYGSWSGFAYSNMTDNVTYGYENQYSAFTRGGMDAGEDGGTNYGVAYVSMDWASGTYDPISVKANITGEEAFIVNGCYVTNATYPYLSMLNGDSFSKKFGGETGNDPDWFKIVVFGIDENGDETNEIEFYLADYRFDDNSLDYVVDNWQWLELSSLGKVTGLRFYLESSDASAYGMNTPAYFCLDNIYINTDEGVGVQSFATNKNNIGIYPNPSAGKFYIDNINNCDLYVYDIQGRLVHQENNIQNKNCFDISSEKSGVYFVKIYTDNQWINKRVVLVN
ncbi:MAG: DUF4465 domain-containing protein [Bacteroidales bacterium]|nr:DUF4465 domain-containing protein [Bacteroidales bacterium]